MNIINNTQIGNISIQDAKLPGEIFSQEIYAKAISIGPISDQTSEHTQIGNISITKCSEIDLSFPMDNSITFSK